MYTYRKSHLLSRTYWIDITKLSFNVIIKTNLDIKQLYETQNLDLKWHQ
jgi:hypothetical protein